METTIKCDENSVLVRNQRNGIYCDVPEDKGFQMWPTFRELSYLMIVRKTNFLEMPEESNGFEENNKLSQDGGYGAVEIEWISLGLG